jgi:hypothetical protein
VKSDVVNEMFFPFRIFPESFGAFAGFLTGFVAMCFLLMELRNGR